MFFGSKVLVSNAPLKQKNVIHCARRKIALQYVTPLCRSFHPRHAVDGPEFCPHRRPSPAVEIHGMGLGNAHMETMWNLCIHMYSYPATWCAWCNMFEVSKSFWQKNKPLCMPVKTCLKLKSSLEIIEFPFPSARVTHLFQPETRHGLHSPSTEILQRSPDFARRLDFQWMQPATNPTYNRWPDWASTMGI